MAVAQGFNPVSVADVEVGQAADRIRLQTCDAGSGNTLPEKRVDRNNPKWSVRAASLSRAIYQNREGDAPAVEETVTVP